MARKQVYIKAKVVPTGASEIINDNKSAEVNTYSSNKIDKLIDEIIDDNKTGLDTTWSSKKIDEAIPTKVSQLQNDSGFNKINSVLVTYGNITVSANNYLELNTNVPSGKKIIGNNINSWGSNSGVFSIQPYANNRAYLIANSGTTVTNLSVTWFYI